MYSFYFKGFLNEKENKSEKEMIKIIQQKRLEFLNYLKKSKPKLIPNKIIQMFYENPLIFFNNYKTYLKNTSYFDECGFSIFNHYFYILFENKEKNKEIYEKNFSEFFTEYKDALLIQDYFLDTPLHKIVKLNNKKNFLKICEKFNEIGILNEKLLKIKNKDNLSCIDYIINNIRINYLSLIIKNEHISYKLIINYYLNNAEMEYEKIILKSFEDGFDFIYIKFNEIKLENIIYIFNNKKGYFYSIIYYFAKQGINFINFFYEICEKGNDYDKLFNLIKNYLIEKNEFEDYIYEHTSYVLRKMNSTNKKGNNEIKYGINLLQFIIDEKIKNKNEKDMNIILLNRKIVNKKKKISTKIFKEGLIYNLMYNPNLSFKKKSEIFLLFKKLTNFNIILQELSNEEFIQFYNFLEFIENNEINKKNIINIYNTNVCFKNILSRFNEYKKIYQTIIELCRESDNKKYYEEFIKLANDLIIRKIPFYIKYYYLSNSEKKINKILKIFLSYIERDYEINPNNNLLNYNLINNFLSNENFTLCMLKNIIKNSFEKNYFYYLEIIFNSEFNLTHFIQEYNNDIKLSLDKINFEGNIKSIKLTKKINLKNIFELIPILQEYPLDYKLTTSNKELYSYQISNKISIKYFYTFLYFTDCSKDLNFLSQTKKFIIYDVKNMIKNNLIFFLNDWDKPFVYDEFINIVEKNILFFCKLLIIDNSLKEENYLKINFFFEFLYELKPELKQNFSNYQTMILNYIDNNKNEEYLGFIDQNTIWNFYLMIILMYIKFKYGNYNPEILFIFLDYYKQYNKIFLLFIKCLKENSKEYRNIINHFFIGDFIRNKKNINYLNEKLKFNNEKKYKTKRIYFLLDNVIFFFNNYLGDLNEINYSLVYNYIISILTEYGKYNKEKECLIPYIMLNIGKNEKIINLILGKITSYEINLYDFIKVEYDIKNENKFRKFIYIFIQTAKKMNLEPKFIFSSNSNTFHLYRDPYYFPKGFLIKNAYQFFSSLKKKMINLYDCIYKNPNFIKQTIDLFFSLLCVYDSCKGKNGIESDDKTLSFIAEEIYEFILKFIYSNNKLKKTILSTLWENDTRKIFLKIFHERILKLSDKNKIKYEYEKLIELLDLYIAKEKKGQFYINFLKDLKEILKFSMEKGVEEWELERLLNYFFKILDFKKESIYSLCHYLILKVIITNIRDYSKYLNYFLSLIKDTICYDNNYHLQKNNFLINYYLRDINYNSITNLFSKFLLQSQNNINQQGLKNCLNRLICEISDKNICTYLLVQIREINFFKNEEEFLLFILDKGINNKFFFNYLFNFLSKERKKYFFDLNKMNIIKSLFLYGQNNDYYFLEKILQFISNYMTNQEIKEIIYPLKGIEEDIKKSVNYLNENIDDNFFKSREKFLFIYCLNKKRKKNYETIALLFNYCPKTFAIFELCPFLNEIDNEKNLDEFHKKMFDYLNYFKTEKNLINNISYDFYKFSLFLEIFQNSLYSLKNFEKKIFLLYVQIFILEMIPKELLIFFKQILGDNIYQELPECEKWFLDEVNKRSKYELIQEKIIFIILCLYEIKRSPLLPIKKYLPDFYSKIEELTKKYKSLNIPVLCLKKPFDINLYDKLKDIIENKPEKIIESLYKKNPMFNLIFIIEKENNFLFNLNTNNYLAKLLYVLLSDNDNNNLQPEKIDDQNFIKSLRYELGTDSNDKKDVFHNTRTNTNSFGFYDDYIDDTNFSDDIIKNCVLSLKNFDHYTDILMENCWNCTINFTYDFLREFRNYLRILFTISNHILSLTQPSFYNQNLPHINVLNKSFFNPFNSKLKLLTKSMNVDKISKNIIKYFYKMEEMDIFNVNKIKSNYFFVVENWLNLYLESPFIQKFFCDIQKENCDYICFFKYLKIICHMLINFLNIISENDYIKFKSIFNTNFKIKLDNIFFKYEPNKENAKKILGESMLNLGNEIIENLKDNKYNNFKTKIVFGYYYNNDINNFVETYSGISLYDFFLNKILNLNLYIEINRYEYEEYKKDINIRNSKNKKNKKKIINKELSYRIFTLFDKVLKEGKKEEINKNLMPYICNYEDINNILNLFDFSQYKNLLTNFLYKTSNEILEPDYRYYSYEIYKYFYDLYFDYIYPVYNFNTLLSKFCYNEYNLCLMYESNIYKNYEGFIDFFELIKAVFNTEFNKDENLNKFFKKELIYFLLDSQNSLIFIFIHEIYNLIRKEMIYRKDKNLIIKNKFKIKVEQGFKYSKQFLSKIKGNLNNNNLNNITNNKINKEQPKEKVDEINDNSNLNNNNILLQKKKKFKLKLNKKMEEMDNLNNQNLISNANTKNNIDSSNNNNGVIVLKNYYKRKIIPIQGYSGFVPNFINVTSKSKIIHMKNIFNNEIIFVNKNEYKEYIKPEKKENKKINIFNLIFRIAKLTKNEIVLNQYDISDILSKNLDKDNLRKIIRENINITPEIPKYWIMHLNLAFIYGQLKYK